MHFLFIICLGTDHLTCDSDVNVINLFSTSQRINRFRDRPFNLKGGGGGDMVFCFVQNFFFGQHKN